MSPGPGLVNPKTHCPALAGLFYGRLSCIKQKVFLPQGALHKNIHAAAPRTVRNDHLPGTNFQVLVEVGGSGLQRD